MFSTVDSGDEEEKKSPASTDREKKGDDSGAKSNEEFRLVLIGKTGSGKSASGNTILGRKQFLSQMSASSVTQVCQLGSTNLADEEKSERIKQRRMRRITVVDMPGFGDTHLSLEEIHAEIAKCVSLSAPGPHAFLLVVPVGRFTDNENQAACELMQIFGEDALCHHTLVLFTRGDDLEGMGIEEYLRQTAPAGLKALIGRCGGRYHVFNNKDSSNSAQVKELLEKVQKMVKQTNTGFYTNAMFLEAEAAIMEEQNRMMRAGDEVQGEEQSTSCSFRDHMTLAKRRKCDLESNSVDGNYIESAGVRGRVWGEGNEDDSRMEEWTEESRNCTFSLLRDGAERFRDKLRGRCRGRNTTTSRRQILRSSLTRMRREAALSAKVLQRVKIMVAAGATGMAVGAMFGAAAPLAAAAGASLVGNSVGFAAAQLAGMSVAGGTGVGKAVGAIVAVASGKTALALGAATGGVLGGSVGAIAGAEADSPKEGALDALGQVSVIGASVVGVAAGVGGTLGAGAALGVALEGSALSTAALGVAENASAGTVSASVAQSSLATAAGHNVLTVAGVSAAPGVTGSSVSLLANTAISDPWSTVTATTQILNAVAEIGKAAAGIALAGGLVVKVVKEKVRCGTGTREASETEKKTYEIFWNK